MVWNTARFYMKGISFAKYKFLKYTIIIPQSNEYEQSTHLLYTRHVELLIRLSDALRCRSSNKSLIAVTPNTKHTGIMEISFPNAPTYQLSSKIKIKYRLASRWNCSSRLLGTNDNNVYLVVRILLPTRRPFGCSRLGVFGGTVWLGTTMRWRSSAKLDLPGQQWSRRFHQGGISARRNV